MNLSKTIILSIFFVFTHSANAIDCSANCPTWPIGVVAASESIMIVSPPSISANFTGCQISWDSSQAKRITIEFKLGKLKRIEALNEEQKYSICHYIEGKPVEGAASICLTLKKQFSYFRGIDAIPVRKDQVNWSDKQCFPTLEIDR